MDRGIEKTSMKDRLAKDEVLSYLKQMASKDKKILNLILYGSRARGDHKDRSDYDVAVFAPEFDHFEWSRWKLDVEERVPRLCGLDLIWHNDNVADDLKAAIDRDGVKFYEKN
jgi:uncharacterized protein